MEKQARAATNARIKELNEAREIEQDKRLAKLKAEEEALDRSIAEEYAKLVRKLENLSVTIRTLVAIGGVMDRNEKILLEKSLGLSYVVTNLKPETLSFFKSVLARPELFRDK